MGLFSKLKKVHKIAAQTIKHVQDTEQQPSHPISNQQPNQESYIEEPEQRISDVLEVQEPISVVFEVPLGGNSPEESEKWTGTKRPREEYKAIAPGETEKKVFDYENGFGDYLTKERTKLCTVEPCGFDFSDVIVNSSDWINFETGEAEKRSTYITPNETNCFKIAKDWTALSSFLKTIPTYIPQFSSNDVLWYIDKLNEIIWSDDNLHSNKKFWDFHCYANIEIEPLTPKGKVKRYPLRSVVDISHSQHKSINLESFYLKNGSIGKGIIKLANGSSLFILDFAFDAKQQDYYVKKARINEGFKLDGFVTLYPH